MTTRPLPRSWRCSTAGRSKSCRSPPDDLQRLLLQHYRPGAQTASAAAGRTAEIGQGRQFLFALVGEALRDNASDIHLEPYEQRCRIRMRIDGKLTERYVVEPGAVHAACKPDQDPRLARHLRETAAAGRAHRLRPRR